MISIEDDVSNAFAAISPLSHVRSVCVDTDLVDFTTDANVTPCCPVETELDDCCEYMCFASLNEMLRSVLI